MKTIVFDPFIWGPHYWFFLHTIAMIYPNHPNAETKKLYYEIIYQFHQFIPVQEMANDYKVMLDLYPIQPYLENKESLLKWMHFIHNHINQRLKKQTMSYDEFYNHYYKLYNQPKPIPKTKYRSVLKKVIQISILFFAMYGIFAFL